MTTTPYSGTPELSTIAGKSMGKLVTYQVKFLNGTELLIDAEDIGTSCPCGYAAEAGAELSCQHSAAWFRFTRNDGDKTVAAIPFRDVLFIVEGGRP